MKRHLFFFALVVLQVFKVNAQHTDANVFGDVKSDKNNEHIPFVNIYIEGTNIGTTTNETGHYMLIDLPEGKHIIVAKVLGYSVAKDTIMAKKGTTIEVNFVLQEEDINLNEVVITGTKTFKRQTESPVIVNVIDKKTLKMVQANNISEGLVFQSGLRIETNCQTCNYTQLRINGLGGGYSQILINGHSIFSPLTGLYGMEQIPANMVERIEIVRGGGSALYGSNAIGGTVNIITKIPQKAGYDFNFTSNQINSQAGDFILNGNINLLTEKRNTGASVFVNHRNRESYDHNNDNFSELPELTNNSFGANLFYKPNYNQKIEINFTSLNEYRYGGEMIQKPAYLAQQSEERTHNVLMGDIDYNISFNEDKNSFIAYLAGQNTKRDHYTGIFPDSSANIEYHLIDPPYGYTTNTTIQMGFQFNHCLLNFLGGKNVFTFGSEYVFDDVTDSIPSYYYVINQTTKNTATFIQSDWDITPKLNLLTGIRMDKHNLLNHIVLSPRASILCKLKNYTQFRLTWGTGFRAPQAFDSDMHIAFAGGGVSRISLASNLKEERSNSLSGSMNFDRLFEKCIFGFTIEGFYTKLNNAFYLHPIRSDELGERFEKRNGSGATVKGVMLEARTNYNRKFQIEEGFTFQTSLYDEAVENITGLEPKKKFLRTPDQYGYITLLITPFNGFNTSVNFVYTGPMTLAHFAGSPGHSIDEYKTSPSFNEISIKISYTLSLNMLDSGIEFFGGIKNVLNSYQNDFDIGKNRDSNYIYGPRAPRTFYFGISLNSI